MFEEKELKVRTFFNLGKYKLHFLYSALDVDYLYQKRH